MEEKKMDNRKELTPEELENVNGAGLLSYIIDAAKRAYEEITNGD
jgi:hypothetical protein